MSELFDLDAIRDRAKQARFSSNVHDHLASAADVPALLAYIATLTEERDIVRADRAARTLERDRLVDTLNARLYPTRTKPSDGPR